MALWLMEAVGQYGMYLATVVVAFWLFILYERSRSDTDPSLRMSMESSMGYAGALVSGSMVSVVLAALVAFLTWPLPVENPLVGLGLLGVVAIHKFTEYGEAR